VFNVHVSCSYFVILSKARISAFMVQRSGFRFQCSMFTFQCSYFVILSKAKNLSVHGSAFMVQRSWFSVQVSGFSVQEIRHPILPFRIKTDT
jgi:hypothetical protein